VNILQGESSVVINDLADGNWEVTAKGYVEIDANGNETIEGEEEFEAASSSAVPFIVSSASSPQVDITLGAAQTGGTPGYFSYSVSFPVEKVDTASLSFTAVDGYSWVQDSGSAYISPKDLTADPEGIISLNPGYYLVRIQLRNSYQMTGRTEIVHIYSNMETRADYVFTAADFTDFIVLSGTVDIKINGTRPDYAAVYAYKTGSYGSWEHIGNSQVQWDGPGFSTGTWSIAILPSSSPRSVFFEVTTNSGSMYMQWDPGVNRTVSTADCPDIPITINRQTLTLSGTADITVNGDPFGGGADESVYLYLHDRDGSGYDYGNQIGYSRVNYSNGGTWSITIEKPAASATYYIRVNASKSGSNGYSKFNVQSVAVSGADVSGIAVSHNFTVLSGTASITVNGASVEGNSWQIYLRSNSDGSGQQIGYGSVNPNDGSWSMALDEAPVTGTCYFYVSGWNSGTGESYYQTNVGTVSFPIASYSGISLSHDYTVLSGTVSITVNNSPPAGSASISVYLSQNPNGEGEIGFASVNPDKSWSMVLNRTPAPGTYYFGVGVWYSGGEGYHQLNVATVSLPTSSYSGYTLTHNFSQ
jgi:hypothetical protein